MILAASAGITISFCAEFKEHLKLLYTIRGMLHDFFYEAEYSLLPMESILRSVRGTKDERLEQLCSGMAERLEGKQGRRGEEIWRESFMEFQKQLGLNQEEFEIIADMGNAFFGKSMEENKQNFTLCMERLEYIIENLRSEQKEKQKICRTIGITCGLMLIILLI